MNVRIYVMKRKLNSDGQVSECCLAPTQQFFSYIMARTS